MIRLNVHDSYILPGRAEMNEPLLSLQAIHPELTDSVRLFTQELRRLSLLPAESLLSMLKRIQRNLRSKTIPKFTEEVKRVQTADSGTYATKELSTDLPCPGEERALESNRREQLQERLELYISPFVSTLKSICSTYKSYRSSPHEKQFAATYMPQLEKVHPRLNSLYSILLPH